MALGIPYIVFNYPKMRAYASSENPEKESYLPVWKIDWGNYWDAASRREVINWHSKVLKAIRFQVGIASRSQVPVQNLSIHRSKRWLETFLIRLPFLIKMNDWTNCIFLLEFYKTNLYQKVIYFFLCHMKKKHIAKLEEFYKNLLNRICEIRYFSLIKQV